MARELKVIMKRRLRLVKIHGCPADHRRPRSFSIRHIHARLGLPSQTQLRSYHYVVSQRCRTEETNMLLGFVDEHRCRTRSARQRLRRQILVNDSDDGRFGTLAHAWSGRVVLVRNIASHARGLLRCRRPRAPPATGDKPQSTLTNKHTRTSHPNKNPSLRGEKMYPRSRRVFRKGLENQEVFPSECPRVHADTAVTDLTKET